MELDQAIKRRFSCRSYKDKKVPLNLISDILNSAIYAPSSGNIQNWRFIIVTDKDKKNEISIAAERQLFIQEAPVLIIVCDETEKVIDYYGDKGKLYCIENCSLATENLLLKAADLDLDTCLVCAFDEKAIRRILHIPDSVIPEAIITLGYGKEEQGKHERNPVETAAYFETYGNKKINSNFFPIEKQLDKIKNKIKR